MRAFRHSDNGENDQAKSQKQDTDQVVRELAPGGDPGGGIKKRRENHEEDEVGVERDSWNSGNEAEQSSRDHEHDGVWDLKLPRQGSERHHEKQQQQENQFHRLDVTSHHRPGISVAGRLPCGKYKSAGLVWRGRPRPRLLTLECGGKYRISKSLAALDADATLARSKISICFIGAAIVEAGR